jgi:hypothetical protein
MIRESQRQIYRGLQAVLMPLRGRKGGKGDRD